MEDYFRSLIEKCKVGELSANDILERVAKSNFTSPTNSTEPTKPVKPEPLEKPEKHTQSQSSHRLITHSSKPNDMETQASEFFELGSITEEDSELQPWDTILAQKIQKRKELIEKYEDTDLQDYIETQLARVFEYLGPIQSKEQLEDIKKKCRMKWFLRMKKLRDSRKLKEEEEFLENCSFQPKINDSDARPRYLQIQPKKSVPHVNRECTFTPNISDVSRNLAERSVSRGKRRSLRCSFNSLGGSISPNKNCWTTEKEIEETKPSQISIKSGIGGGRNYKKMCLDDELNDMIGSFSPESLQKDTEPKLNVRDLLYPSQEHMKVEKVLRFTSSKKSGPESRKQSLVDSRNMGGDKHLLKGSQSTKNCGMAEKDRFMFNNNKKTQSRGHTPKASSFRNPSSRKEGKEALLSPSLSKRDENFMNNGGKALKSPVKNILPEETLKILEDPNKREERLNERKIKKLDEINKENKEKHPFKPQISEAARSIDRKVYEDKVTNFVKNKEERLAKLREEKARKELEGVTHQPQINGNVAASSKLNINGSTKEYIQALKAKEDAERHFLEIANKRKEALETIECTHTPQISSKPSYLKKDSTSSKLSLQSSQSLQSSNYRMLHQKKKGTSTNSSTSSLNKLIWWSQMQKEDIYVPSLFENISSKNGDTPRGQDDDDDREYF